MQAYDEERDESSMDERAEGEMEMETEAQGGQEARGGRGFAGMSPQKRREIAAKGGRSQGKDNNSGNFANNRQKAVAAGRLGGQNSRGGGRRSDQAEQDTQGMADQGDGE